MHHLHDPPHKTRHLVATGSINAGVRNLAVEGIQHLRRKYTQHRRAVLEDHGHLCSAAPASHLHHTQASTAVSCTMRAQKSGANDSTCSARARFNGLVRCTEQPMQQGLQGGGLGEECWRSSAIFKPPLPCSGYNRPYLHSSKKNRAQEEYCSFLWYHRFFYGAGVAAMVQGGCSDHTYIPSSARKKVAKTGP